jgi:hypothetical protein
MTSAESGPVHGTIQVGRKFAKPVKIHDGALRPDRLLDEEPAANRINGK